ncbi:11046_t:CDS:2, partial [Racocetra persica]
RQAQQLLGRNFTNKATIEPFRLPPFNICIHCNTKKFTGESEGFCCLNGRVILANIEVSATLQNLFSRTDEVGCDFHANIQAYNSLFAFTSMSFHFDQHLANIQGGVYYAIRPLLPSNNNSPKYLQLYIYDTEHEINNRLSIMPDLRHETIELIKTVFDEVNPFVTNFRHLSIFTDITNYRITIRANHGLDQQTYNTPIASQVAAIWVDGSDPLGFQK